MLVKKFFRIYVNEIYYCSSRRVEHDGENRIENKHHLREINYFKYIFNMLRTYLLISVSSL
jgi:hypothetical protein